MQDLFDAVPSTFWFMPCKYQVSNRHERKTVAEIRVQESIIQRFLFVQSKN